MPAVSIIIPAYGRADFVNQAVAGIGQQTFTDYEIIVVDDGSGDVVVAGYQLPPTAKLIRRETNSGRASIPRNDGFRVSRGRYLAFLDMDDVWLPEKLASQVAILDAHPEIGVTYCHYHQVDEILQPLPKQIDPPSVGADFLAEMIDRCFIRSPSLTLIRREALEAAGVFDEEIIGTCDWDMWLRLARSVAFHLDPSPLVRYRVYGNQQSQNQPLMRRGNIVVLEKQRQWITGNRPDLLPFFRRTLSRRYYLYLETQLAMGDDVPAIRHTLAAAFANRPASLRVYKGYGRLAWYALRRWLAAPG